MPRNYEPEFKKKIVRLHIEQGRTYKSITEEYDVSKASIFKWCSEFSEECQSKAQSIPNAPMEANATIVRFWIFMIAVLLPALQIRISQLIWQYAR